MSTNISTTFGFEDLCGSDFWNSSLLQEEWPQFTPRFLSIVPVWVPCLFVWLFFPYFLINVHKRDSVNNPLPAFLTPSGDQQDSMRTHGKFTWVVNLKMFFTSVQIVLAFVRWLDILHKSVLVLPAISGPFLMATYGLTTFELWYERRKGHNPLFPSFYFYSLNVILGIAPLYDRILHGDCKRDVTQFTGLVLSIALNLLCFVLCFVPDLPYDKDAIGDDGSETHICPEVITPYPSTLSFSWITRLIVTGFKRPIVADDIWDLNPRDQSRRLNPIFERLWTAEMAKARSRDKNTQNDSTDSLHITASQYGSNNSFYGDVSVLYEKVSEKTSLLERSTKTQWFPFRAGVKRKARPNLFKVLFVMLWKNAALALLQKVLADVMMLLGPLILGGLIDHLSAPDDYPRWQAYGLSFALLCTLSTRSMLFAQAMYRSAFTGIHIKTTLMAAIFRKSLTLSSSAKREATVGETVNLMSVDCQRLEEIMTMFAFTMSTPFQIVMTLALLYSNLGPAVFAGVGVMVLLIAINFCLGNLQKDEQSRVLKLKDDRIKLVNQILNGIKVLKLYAWEDEFKKKVTAIRNLEIARLMKMAFLYITSCLGFGLAPFVVGLFSFVTYILSDREHVLDARKAFVSLALFNTLNVPTNYVTTGTIYTIQAIVSIQRISQFLIAEDLDPNNVTHDPTADNAVEISSGKFTWDSTSWSTLSGINLKIPVGQLVAVVGTVGSGKSSLISAIIGEMEKLQGQVKVKGSVAYVSQQAWIQNASVRDNILFGSPYNRRRYKACVKACQLERDLQILAAGDATEIGEKGINLSGGQKQRVNLARAAYSNADIYLFDDPLSAVDAHVGKAIFDELIGPQGILARKTRILVTHGIQWLPSVDDVIVIANGTISEQGSYQSLLANDGAFAQFLRNFASEGLKEKTDEETTVDIGHIPVWKIGHRRHASSSISLDDGDPPKKLHRSHSHSSTTSTIHKRTRSRQLSFQNSFELSMDMTTSASATNAKDGQLTVVETVETKKVDKQIFIAYGRAAGFRGLGFALLGFCTFHAMMISGNFWLTKWTQDPLLLNKSTRTTDEGIARSDYNLTIYGLFGVVEFCALLLFQSLFWTRMVLAARRLHAMLLKTIFHAPMAFFDQTPIGRILNRFARDVDVVDTRMPIIIKDFLDASALLISSLLVVTIKSPLFAAILVPICVFFMVVQTYYVRTSRQLKRIESVSRSPIYTHFSEAITGAAVIRAYGAKQRFFLQSEEKIDTNQVYYFASQAAIRWLQVRIDILVTTVIFSSALLQVIFNGGGSDAGLSVSYALQTSIGITYLVRQISEFETNIVSVERLKEYSSLQQEADFVIPHNRPEKSWPQNGDVIFDDYQTRYREGLDLVLKGVNCHIRSMEKIGIVGRTGAGKSSLTLALFRILEAAGGRITIDGINIADIGLHDLRGKLTILPQDPVLFSGSLRMNIDPFDDYSDDQLWNALRQSHLKDFVTGQQEGLGYECGEEGLNLSVGQRQLVCLARALLRHTKVLILDEATAAIDFETDSLIQKTIRDAFSHCTIIAIAHRINTIMDYDRVMVMDNGVIRELDSPQNLIKQKGIFYSMCHDAGLV